MKLLWFSDGPMTPTGFSNQSRGILDSVKEDWEIHYLAHNYHGRKTKRMVLDDGERFDYTIYPGGKQPYARDVFQKVFYDVKPRVLGILLDTFMLYPYFLDLDFTGAKTLFYFPSDGGGFPLDCEKILEKVDVPVAMSKYARDQVADDFGITAEYIPHATDPRLFKPLPENKRMELRRKWGIPEDVFVFGDVARNQPRKNLTATITSFKEFVERNPGEPAVLFLHTDVTDVAAHMDLRRLANDLGVGDKVFFTSMNWYDGLPQSRMNEVYNLMDCRVSSTSGEGWGICTIEAMAAGLPQVITDYTTTKEIVLDHDAGVGVPPACEVVGTWGVKRAFVNDTVFAEKMEEVYFDRSRAKRMGENGRKAVIREYSWKVVGREWQKLLRSLV